MRSIIRLIVTLLLLNVGIYPAHACMQLYRSLLDGTIIHDDFVSDIPQPHFDLESADTRKILDQKLHRAYELYNKTHAIQDYSDFGAYLVYSGQYKRAQKIFQEIEAKKPDFTRPLRILAQLMSYWEMTNKHIVGSNVPSK